MQEEIWKDVKGFEGIYMVSNKGRLLSKAKGDLRILSTKNSKGDYIRVAFRTKNKTKTFSLHKLVYEAFKGETPKGVVLPFIIKMEISRITALTTLSF